MKKIQTLAFFIFYASLIIAQPCKKINPGMTKSEVLKLIGKANEINTLGYNVTADGEKELLEVWQYKNTDNDNHQRVEFTGEKVTSVIADGEKYDELMKAFQKGDFPKEELIARIDRLNKEACK